MVASRLILVATDNHETHNTCFLFIAVTALWAICRSKNSTNATPLLSLVSLSLRMVTLTEKTNKQTNKCKKVRKQQQEGTENNDVHVSDLQMSNLHKALELDSTTGNRDLKIRRRRPQRERGFITKTTTLHVHHAFLYISLPSLHDYDVKMPNFTLYRGRAQATTKFPPSF